MSTAHDPACNASDTGSIEAARTSSAALGQESADPPTGYLHPGYAESLSEFGTPRRLPSSGGRVLERHIRGTPYRDAMGCYPLFACEHWDKLPMDLDLLSKDLVSLALVADPFGDYQLEDLQRSFDLVHGFKEHLVTDLSQPASSRVSRHHRYYALRALRTLRIERCQRPISFLDDWAALYEHLRVRHDITGIRAFSRATFAKQLSLPGLVMYRACLENRTVGMVLYYLQGPVAYGHLLAASAEGYKFMAPYALLWYAQEDLRDEVRWVDHGSSAGLDSSESDPLWQFKSGWSTGVRTALFCGKIFQPERYTELVTASGKPPTDYFPAYRVGEYSDSGAGA